MCIVFADFEFVHDQSLASSRSRWIEYQPTVLVNKFLIFERVFSWDVHMSQGGRWHLHASCRC